VDLVLPPARGGPVAARWSAVRAAGERRPVSRSANSAVTYRRTHA